LHELLVRDCVWGGAPTPNLFGVVGTRLGNNEG